MLSLLQVRLSRKVSRIMSLLRVTQRALLKQLRLRKNDYFRFKIFEQMENELAKAKAATTKASQDKHLHGLMLLVQLAKTGDETTAAVEPIAIQPTEPAQIASMDGKKIELEDGANGDSLLDF